MTRGAAIRTGASAELPASLRGGGFGLAAATTGGGAGTAGALGGGTAAILGAAATWTGLRSAGTGLVASALGLAATFGAAGFGGICFGAALARLPCGATVLAVLRGLPTAAAGALATEAFTAGLRGGAFTVGRLVAADLGAGLDAGRRRAAVDLLAAAAERFAAGFALALALGRADAGRTAAGRAAGTRRVAVACLAAAAVFLAFGGGRRAGLLDAFPAEGRFPDPLAGVDAFMRAFSPSSFGHGERGTPSISLGTSPEKPERAMPWTAEPESAKPSFLKD